MNEYTNRQQASVETIALPEEFDRVVIMFRGVLTVHSLPGTKKCPEFLEKGVLELNILGKGLLIDYAWCCRQNKPLRIL